MVEIMFIRYELWFIKEKVKCLVVKQEIIHALFYTRRQLIVLVNFIIMFAAMIGILNILR